MDPFYGSPKGNTFIIKILIFNEFIINWKRKNHVQPNSFQTFALSEILNVVIYTNLHYGTY